MAFTPKELDTMMAGFVSGMLEGQVEQADEPNEVILVIEDNLYMRGVKVRVAVNIVEGEFDETELTTFLQHLERIRRSFAH